MNYLLGTGEPTQARLVGREEQCFWTTLPVEASLAVLNPFLAYPPFPPVPNGAMVSAPSFAEAPAQVSDPGGRLVGTPPERMGGFVSIPPQRRLAEFAEETERVAAGQYEYALRQIESNRFDAVFLTVLTVDRIQHSAWRHFDPTDPTHPGTALQDLIPRAHRQLDDFIGAARALSSDEAVVAVFSDHGHGQRASIGINFHELFRREGLFAIADPRASRRAVETLKTLVLSYADTCHLNEPVLWLARRMPGKAALKSGASAGVPAPGSLRVPDLAGSNPFGGIETGGDDGVTQRVTGLLGDLRHRGRPVLRWVRPAEEVLPGGRRGEHYPDLLFELEPRYAPTWNLYGPVFAPIATHVRISGGHTRRGVYATSQADQPCPEDSVEVHAALAELCRCL